VEAAGRLAVRRRQRKGRSTTNQVHKRLEAVRRTGVRVRAGMTVSAGIDPRRQRFRCEQVAPRSTPKGGGSAGRSRLKKCQGGRPAELYQQAPYLSSRGGEATIRYRRAVSEMIRFNSGFVDDDPNRAARLLRSPCRYSATLADRCDSRLAVHTVAARGSTRRCGERPTACACAAREKRVARPTRCWAQSCDVGGRGGGGCACLRRR
jgi:hypothetical protein